MSENMVVQCCSPTLAGLKTGSLFVCPFESVEEQRRTIRLWNRRLRSCGLRMLPLRRRNNKALIYLFRDSHLARDLQQAQARQLLAERGYDCDNPGSCILHLMRRLRDCEDFPHEIGLFLGYPPEDVLGFIQQRECKCIGCWKVYGDEQAAKATFAKYKRCTEFYRTQCDAGRSIERLIVAG